MNRYGHILCCMVLLLAGSGCRDDGSRSPATGRYAYRASHSLPETSDSLRLSGVLVIRYSTADSIAGHWEVERLHPELWMGRWDQDAYLVYASPAYVGTLVHRIRRTGGAQELDCSGYYTWIATGGIERELPLTCELSLIDTDTAGVPPGVPPPTYPYTAPLPTDSPDSREPDE